MDPLVQFIIDRGWNPDQPNDACKRALERPQALARLSPEDADGGHFILSYLEYDRMMQDAPFDADAMHGVQLWSGTYAVLAYNGLLPMPAEEIHERRHKFELWHRDVLVPSRKRFWDAMRTHDREWIEAHQADFEPAFTQGQVERARFFADDLDLEQKRMSLGIALQDQGTNRIKGDPDAMGFETFLGYFEFLTNPNRAVTRYGPDGIARIDPLLVKQAMDEETFRVKNPRNQRGSGLLQDARVDENDPSAALQIAETVEIIDGIVKADGLRGRTKRAAEVVAEHIRELLSGATTIRSLANRTGVSRPALQAAFDLVRERIDRKLG